MKKNRSICRLAIVPSVFLSVAASLFPFTSTAFSDAGEEADRYGRLAAEARDVGNYERSRAFFLDMLGAAGTIGDPGQRAASVFKAHSGLRDVCLELGLFDEAIVHGRYCVDSFRGDSTFKPHDASLSYALLGSVYVYAGRYDEAFAYVDSAFSLLREDSPVMYRRSIPKMLGIVAANSGNWPLAEKAYRRGLEIERTLPLSEERVASINLLANSIYQQDRYDEALELYLEQERVSREVYGEGSTEALRASYQITNVLAFAGDIEGACRKYVDVEGEYVAKLRSLLRTLPGGRREAYLSDITDVMKAMTPFGVAAKANDDEFTMTAYNAIMATKGLLLASERNAAGIISEYGSEADRVTLDSLTEGLSRLSVLEASPQREADKIAEVYSKVLELDSRLAASCAEYGDIGSFLDDDYEAVCSRLKPGEAVVDYYDYTPSSSGRKYVAYVYKSGMRYPHRAEICRQQSLDSLKTLEKNIMSNLYSAESGDALRRLLVDPVADYVEGCSRVYFVPSGEIHNIALESLPSASGGLLSDSIEMVRISSAREVGATGMAASLDAAIFGGIDYSDPLYQPLPSSRQEVEEIWRMMDKEAALFTGTEASAVSVASFNGMSPSIMHFSTHGFCYSPDHKALPPALQGRTDAMDLCGLVMSDRLLPGSEIAAWDLGNTRFVSLASCDTGLGRVTPEGIYGLQRAFKRAGAGTMLMSLWEASDVASRMFMTEFYRALASGGGHPREACATARMKVREAYPHPFYWAGFVVVD